MNTKRLFSKMLALVLTATMILNMIPITINAEDEIQPGAIVEILAFEPLPDDVAKQNVMYGTEIWDLILPSELMAMKKISASMPLVATPTDLPEERNEEQPEPLEIYIPVSVIWEATPEYDKNTPGEYIFTATLRTDYLFYELPPSITVIVEDETEPSDVLTIIPKVISVTVYPTAAAVQKGETLQLSADVVVEGGAEQTVVWNVEGNDSCDTWIDENGLLTVAMDETAAELFISATSTEDETQCGFTWVTVLPDLTVDIVTQSQEFINFDSLSGTGLSGYGSNGKFLAPIDPPDTNAIPIQTAQDLDNIRNNLSGSYVLMNNIDLSGFNGGEWVPIGDNSSNSNTSRFTGTFDGQGYVIRNLKITVDTSYPSGLFGYISSATIKNIGLENTNVTKLGSNMGSIVGFSNEGEVINCYNEGVVEKFGDGYYTGGIVGYNNAGAIVNCQNSASVGGDRSVGGIVGYNVLGTIKGCSNFGEIGGTTSTGGIAGYSSGVVTLSYNTGFIRGNTWWSNNGFGGIVGVNNGSITQCYNQGNIRTVTDYAYVGGIAGKSSNNSNDIENCFNIGTVEETISSYSRGTVYSGIVGDGSARNCYNIGHVYLHSAYLNYVYNISSHDSINCYYLIGIVNGDNSGIGMPKTTEEMQTLEFLNLLNVDNVWEMVEGYAYPQLRGLPPAGPTPVDSGTENTDPYNYYIRVVEQGTNNPIPGATVTVGSSLTGTLTATSDSAGQVSFAKDLFEEKLSLYLLSLHGELVVEKDGYVAYQQITGFDINFIKVVYLTPMSFNSKAGKYIDDHFTYLYRPIIEGNNYYLYRINGNKIIFDGTNFSTDTISREASYYLLDSEYNLVSNQVVLQKAGFLNMMNGGDGFRNNYQSGRFEPARLQWERNQLINVNNELMSLKTVYENGKAISAITNVFLEAAKVCLALGGSLATMNPLPLIAYIAPVVVKFYNDGILGDQKIDTTRYLIGLAEGAYAETRFAYDQASSIFSDVNVDNYFDGNLYLRHYNHALAFEQMDYTWSYYLATQMLTAKYLQRELGSGLANLLTSFIMTAASAVSGTLLQVLGSSDVFDIAMTVITYSTEEGINLKLDLDAIRDPDLIRVLNLVSEWEKESFRRINSDNYRHHFGNNELLNIGIQLNQTVVIRCPVDVVVYNSNGQIIGRVINDAIDETFAFDDNNPLVIMVTGNTKVFSFPSEYNYSIEITATDLGLMSYMEWKTNTTGDIVSETSISNIFLVEGSIFNVNSLGSSSEPNYSLLFIENEQINVVISIILAVNGQVMGAGSYIKGNSILLLANPNEGYLLEGWYESGVKIAGAEELIGFEAVSNRTLEARFVADNGLSSDTTLSELTINTGTLTPEFDPRVLVYEATVSNNISELIITAIANHENAVVLGNGVKSLNVGLNTFDIIVTAENGITLRTYRVSITRESTGLLNPVVTGVIVNPSTVTVQKGANRQFTVTVTGSNNPSQGVMWSINGKISVSSTISNGFLTVGADETASILTVVATSTADSTKSGIATVTVPQEQPPISYTVTFNGNGGTPSTPSITVNTGTTLGTALPWAMRTNHSFHGWNTASDGTGTAFTGTTIVNGNITVYAMWSAYTPPYEPTYEPSSEPTPRPASTPTQQSTTLSISVNGVVVNYTLSNGNINLSLSSRVISELIAITDGKVIFDFSTIEGAISVTLPKNAVKAFSDAGFNIEIILPQGSVTFGQTAAVNIVSSTQGSGITVFVKKADISFLTEEQKAAAGNRPIYELAVYDGTRMILNFNGFVEVKLPYELLPGENLNAVVIYYVATDGTLKLIPNCRYENGYVIFTTTHFSIYMIDNNPVMFSDIIGHWAQNPIIQAGARELINGYPDGTFNPNANVTRAEFIQMIYNVLDLQVVNLSGNVVFSDVTSDMWFYNAIGAARQVGLLNGIVYDGLFRPNEPITRLEMADVLSKLATSRRVRPLIHFQATSFTDFYEIYPGSIRAVELAINAGFLNENGMGDGSFQPWGYTTRAQATIIQMTILRVLSRLN